MLDSVDFHNLVKASDHRNYIQVLSFVKLQNLIDDFTVHRNLGCLGRIDYIAADQSFTKARCTAVVVQIVVIIRNAYLVIHYFVRTAINLDYSCRARTNLDLD